MFGNTDGSMTMGLGARSKGKGGVDQERETALLANVFGRNCSSMRVGLISFKAIEDKDELALRILMKLSTAQA